MERQSCPASRIDVGVPTGKYSDARPVNIGVTSFSYPYYAFTSEPNGQSRGSAFGSLSVELHHHDPFVGFGIQRTCRQAKPSTLTMRCLQCSKTQTWVQLLLVAAVDRRQDQWRTFAKSRNALSVWPGNPIGRPRALSVKWLHGNRCAQIGPVQSGDFPSVQSSGRRALNARS